MQMFLLLLMLAIPFVVAVFIYAFVTGKYFMSGATALIFGAIAFMLIAYQDELTASMNTTQPKTTITAPAVTTTVQPQRTVTVTPTVTVTHAGSSHDEDSAATT